MCFSCRTSPYHDYVSCDQHLRILLQRSNTNEALHLRWELENCKKCPSCSTRISREEGCNKVDCLFCGHKFCW
ncbi:hypothetical protein EDD86DRAFT_200999 [Gorgonomyces haynaldii]|nr:hypothetical protein EDD86DRAFT_200999 [Gorgonomyces haynaldii]